MMLAEHDKAVKRIFGEALDKPKNGRAAFLDAACHGDDKLRARVDVLLDAHEDAGEFLSAPTHDGEELLAGSALKAETMETCEPKGPGEGPGTTIGRYKLLQRVGEGGFGVCA